MRGKVIHHTPRAASIPWAALFLLFVPTANANHWADEPLNKPPIPTVGGQNASYPIDAFTLAKLAEKGLRPSPPGPMNPGAEARNFGRKRARRPAAARKDAL